MLKFYNKVLKFAGEYAKNIKIAVILSFFENGFKYGSIIMVYFAITKIIKGTLNSSDIYRFLAILITMIIITIILKFYFYKLQSGSGYDIGKRERLSIGNIFKRFSMGYFTKGNLGKISSIITSDLSFFEENGMNEIDKLINSYLSVLIGIIFMSFISLPIGLITLLIVFLARWAFTLVEKVGKEEAPIRQELTEHLTDSVVEYAMGISVIKAFNMAGERARVLKSAIDNTKKASLRLEHRFILPSSIYLGIFAIGSGILAFASLSFYHMGFINSESLILLLIFSLYIFLPLHPLISANTIIAIMSASLDRYEAVKNTKIIDSKGKDVKLKSFDIEFDNVNFSYQDKETLKNVSFVAKEQAMTALVGPSGSGKTTIANLIARFWDVDSGSIKIGGIDIREMTCDSLLKNISMVFQRVYLFDDTIKNNIKFGNPNASDEEIIEAAKKARCHEFISNLPKGYDTMVNSGGTSLSGGEKQRISIARAILKDSPIIILDEATASVDPDNERFIQEAINNLVVDKTLIVIAHRLATIKKANQILVIDEGNLVESGTHESLLKFDGVYANLWHKRVKSKSWKMAR